MFKLFYDLPNWYFSTRKKKSFESQISNCIVILNISIKEKKNHINLLFLLGFQGHLKAIT